MSDTSDEAIVAAPLRQPPTTGHADLDEVLLSVADLGERALAEQLGALTAAHERVNSVLAPPGAPPPPEVPPEPPNQKLPPGVPPGTPQSKLPARPGQ